MEMIIDKKGNAEFIIDYYISGAECCIRHYGINLCGEEQVYFEEIEFPSEIEGRPVTSMGDIFDRKFEYQTISDDKRSKKNFINSEDYHRSRVGNLIIPNSVKKINVELFKFSMYVECVTWPSSIPKIPGCSFFFSKITSVNLPKEVTEIGFKAFAESTIESITLPEKCQKIHCGAFKKCENLRTINFPNTLKDIDGLAFSESGIENIIWPESCKIVHHAVFRGCKNLKNIKISGGIRRICSTFIQDCDNIQTLDLSKITTICTASMDFYESLSNTPNVILPINGIIIEDE